MPITMGDEREGVGQLPGLKRSPDLGDNYLLALAEAGEAERSSVKFRKKGRSYPKEATAESGSSKTSKRLRTRTSFRVCRANLEGLRSFNAPPLCLAVVRKRTRRPMPLESIMGTSARSSSKRASPAFCKSVNVSRNLLREGPSINLPRSLRIFTPAWVRTSTSKEAPLRVFRLKVRALAILLQGC